MSIEISNVSKFYGEQKALDNITLSIKSGEILGLLGPNGAGKSTLMKIITCFIPPTQGKVTVNGYDISENSLEVRKQVGYLPENNPLYTEMYIREYLEFVAGINKMKADKTLLDNIISTTGLQPEQNKKIAQLSKGYRQRVGLAQALLPSPNVLILDEPTSGLDPNQLVDIRNLIKEAGREKTVLLSTHIMQEVEAVCDRVVIIDKGRIIADDSTSNITQYYQEDISVITVEFDKEIEASILHQINGITNVKKATGNHWVIEADSKEEVRNKLFKLAVDNDLTILSLSKEKENLEKVFHRLTNQKK
ncbi:MAG TPA: gliding motility-associated ABC transporter ATP-binding subunit GldA [Bacteroidales bacterium]|nr:gliding motility-associated ABC transporter ATP-binding subunit GldA [Bacteroidales bacterium]